MDNFKIGKIEAANVVVGPHGRITASAPDEGRIRADALRELRTFIELLPAYSSYIENPDDIRARARQAETALQERPLNRKRIKSLLTGISVGVGTVGALAAAIESVQTVIGRLLT